MFTIPAGSNNSDGLLLFPLTFKPWWSAHRVCICCQLQHCEYRTTEVLTIMFTFFRSAQCCRNKWLVGLNHSRYFPMSLLLVNTREAYLPTILFIPEKGRRRYAPERKSTQREYQSVRNPHAKSFVLPVIQTSSRRRASWGQSGWFFLYTCLRIGGYGEVCGSFDTSTPFSRFPLRQLTLTLSSKICWGKFIEREINTYSRYVINHNAYFLGLPLEKWSVIFKVNHQKWVGQSSFLRTKAHWRNLIQRTPYRSQYE